MPTRQVTAKDKKTLRDNMRKFVKDYSQFSPRLIKTEYNESTQTHTAHYQIDSVE